MKILNWLAAGTIALSFQIASAAEDCARLTSIEYSENTIAIKGEHENLGPVTLVSIPRQGTSGYNGVSQKILAAAHIALDEKQTFCIERPWISTSQAQEN